MKRTQLRSPARIIDPNSAEGSVIAGTTKPSIYGQRARPLISRYPKAYKVQSKHFEAFFKELVKDAKEPLDSKELRRLLAIAVTPKPMKIETETKYLGISDSTRFHVYLAGCLFLRSLYLQFADNKELAALFALNAIKTIESWEYWPFELDIKNELRVGWLQRSIPNSNEQEVRRMLEEFYFYPLRGDQKIESEVAINPNILEKFAKRFRTIMKYDPLWIIYPHTNFNIYGIFGESLENSDLSAYQPENKTFTKNHIAVLLQHPCEADQLEKAKVMLERGVQVENPLGRLFVDSLEFSLFGWVVGTRLDKIKDEKVWEAYGRFIRFAHNNGIAIDDAAGRNAIWNGTEIIGIDFEHTWISKEAKPLKWPDRRPAVQRIRSELSGDLFYLYNAFRRGYDKY